MNITRIMIGLLLLPLYLVGMLCDLLGDWLGWRWLVRIADKIADTTLDE